MASPQSKIQTSPLRRRASADWFLVEDGVAEAVPRNVMLIEVIIYCEGHSTGHSRRHKSPRHRTVIMDTDSHSRFVHDILRATWQDFYCWEEEDFRHTIEALRPPKMVTKTPSLLPQWTQIQPHAGPIHGSQDTLDSPWPWTEVAVSELSLDEIEIMEYQTLDGPNDVTTKNLKDLSFISVTLEMPEGMPSCPQYEACTPLDQNILLGDDPAAMAFLPFADDPSFDQMSYFDEYEYLSWQCTTRDPNCTYYIYNV